MTEIATQPLVKKRAAVIAKMINVALELKILGNFNGKISAVWK